MVDVERKKASAERSRRVDLILDYVWTECPLAVESSLMRSLRDHPTSKVKV
jgi:hypothetical protein